MNLELTFDRIILYYDCPQVFVAKDQVDTSFICLLCEANNEHHLYLCTAISPVRLSNLEHNKVDLRTVFTESEAQVLFRVAFNFASERGQVVDSLSPEKVLEDWLPGEGLLIGYDDCSAVVAEAKQEGAAAIVYSLEPSDTEKIGTIRADMLAEAIINFQRLVKYAYQKIATEIPSTLKQSIKAGLNPELLIHATQLGSFEVHFQSVERADWTGYVHISKALARIDDIASKVGDADATVLILQQNSGHLATTYRDWLKFIIDNKAPICYSWATPEMTEPNIRRISETDAAIAYEAIVSRVELSTEQVILTGFVMALDVERNTWRLKSIEGGKEYYGRCGPDVHLGGITAETVRYRFECNEVLEAERGTGRKDKTFVLMSYRRG